MRRVWVAVVVVVAVAAAPAPAYGAPSLALDPTFGSGGRLTFSAAPGNNYTRLFDTEAYSDGSTVSVGVAYQDGPQSDGDLLVVRRNADGGAAWAKTVPVNLVANGDDVLYDVSLGGGVITGVGDAKAASGRDLVVLQLDEQGNTTTFGGGDGVFTHSFGVFDSFRGGVRLAAGDIAVGGETSGDAINGNAVAALVKSDGSGLNSTFGVVNTSLGGTRADRWNDLDANGNVIHLGGTSDVNSGNDNPMFGAVNATTGALVMPFGAFALSTAGMDGINGIDVFPDGGVIGAGQRSDGGPLVPIVIARHADGGANTRFNGTGQLDVPMNDQNFAAFTDGQLDSAGRFVTAGWAFRNSSAGSADAAVAVVDPGGTVAAKATHDIGGHNDFPEAVALTDTAAVAAGVSDSGGRDVAAAIKVDLKDGAAPGTGGNAPPAVADLEVEKLEVVESAISQGFPGPPPAGTPAVNGAVGVGRHYHVRARIRNNGPDPALVNRVTLSSRLLPGGDFQEVAAAGQFLSDGLPATPLRPGEFIDVHLFLRYEDAGERGLKVEAYPALAEDRNPSNNEKSLAAIDVFGVADSRLTKLPVKIPMGEPDTISGTAFGFTGAEPVANTQVMRLGLAAIDPRGHRVTRAEVAIVRLEGRAKAARARTACRWLKNRRAGFKRIKPTRGVCDRAVWLRADGTSRWRFKLARGLPRGRYVVYSRATNAAGLSERSFSRKDGNRIAFRVRR